MMNYLLVGIRARRAHLSNHLLQRKVSRAKVGNLSVALWRVLWYHHANSHITGSCELLNGRAELATVAGACHAIHGEAETTKQIVKS
eukprot:1344449-Amorphochlora_amoeboformis.AAC.2